MQMTLANIKVKITYPLFDPMGTGKRWNSSRPIQTTPIDKKCQGLNWKEREKFERIGISAFQWADFNDCLIFQHTIGKFFWKCDGHRFNGILLPKLFWSTVRKNCSSDWEKLLKLEAEDQEFAKFLRSLEQFIQAVKGQNNFW